MKNEFAKMALAVAIGLPTGGVTGFSISSLSVPSEKEIESRAKEALEDYGYQNIQIGLIVPKNDKCDKNYVPRRFIAGGDIWSNNSVTGWVCVSLKSGEPTVPSFR